MRFFPKIDEVLDQALKLDQVKAWHFVIDREAKDEIIRLNTEDQLEEEGIDAKGVSLGPYSEFTKAIKRSKGQRTDHVTLKDTGAFYNSFIVVVKDDGFEIIADDVSLYDRPLSDIYGIDILGLTEDNKSFLGDFIYSKYLEYIERELLQ